MKEIVIELNDTTYESLTSPSVVIDFATIRNLIEAIVNGKVLQKGHTELIDTKELIQSVARSADNMKDNGVAPVFDVHEITNMILSQEVIIEADKGEDVI